MRWKMYASALPLAAATVIAACSEMTLPGDSSFLYATVAGSVEVQYAGSGTFRVLPANLPRPHFTLHSTGIGASADQGFAFHAMEAPTPAPTPGSYAIGELDAATFRANYWIDEGTTRRIFRAQSGSVQISESTGRRVKGSFQLAATLLYDCTLEPGFPGQIMTCAPAAEAASVEISGSFEASPLGGESPGLIPYPG